MSLRHEAWLFPPIVSDPGDQSGSPKAIYDLDSKVTPSLLPHSVGHTGQPYCVGELNKDMRTRR